MLQFAFNSLVALFGRDDRRLNRKGTKRRNLSFQPLEERTVLDGDHHAYFISAPIEPSVVEARDIAPLARVALVGEGMLTTVKYNLQGPIDRAFVNLDVLRADRTWGQDGIYETPLRGGVTIDGNTLKIEFSPYGRDFPQGLFFEVAGQVSTDVEHGELVGLSNPHAAITAYDLNTWMPAPVDVHYLGADNPVHTVRGEVEQAADLAVRLSGPPTVEANGIISYTVGVTNTGPSVARGARIVLPALPGMTLETVETDPSWTVIGNEIVLALGNIGPNEGVLSRVSFSLGEVGTSVEMQAAVMSQTTDPNAGNNLSNIVTTTVTHPLIYADLSAHLSGPPTVEANGVISYTVIASNLGPYAAQNAKVILPELLGMTLDTVRSDPSWVSIGGSIVSVLGDIPSGQTIMSTVSFSLGNVGNSVEMEAYVRSDNDPNTANNTSAIVTTLVTEPAELFVTVKNIGLSDAAVKNEKNINLLRFEAHAGPADDVLLTSASFDADAGSLLNVQNYSLWVDTDGDSTVDTVLQTGTVPVGGVIMFDEHVGSGYVVPAGNTVVFEVHGDVASSLASNSLQLDIIGVEAEGSDDGSSLSGSQITVMSVPSKIWTFVDSGELYVTEDSAPLRKHQLLGGALGETILRLEVMAEYEAADVYKLFVSLPGNVVSIDRLELYREGETTPFALATIAGAGPNPVPVGYTTFAANMHSRQLVVPEGNSVDILVRPRVKTDNNGAISGENVQALLLSSFASVEARGDTSSNTIDVSIAGSIAGPVNKVVLSKITSVTNANPDANGTYVPSGVSPIAQFRFTAAANVNDLNGTNKVALETLTIVVDATNVLVNAESFRFYNKSDSTVKHTTVVTTLDGTVLTGNITGRFLVRVMNLSTSAVDTVLDSGESATFSLEADIRNPVIDGTRTSNLQGTLDLREDAFSWYDQDVFRTLHHGVDLGDELIRSTLYQS